MKSAVFCLVLLCVLAASAQAAKTKVKFTLVERAIFGSNLYVAKGGTGFDFGDPLAAAEVPVTLNEFNGTEYGSKIGTCTVVAMRPTPNERPEYYCIMTFKITNGPRLGEIQVAGTFRRGTGAFKFVITGGTDDFLGATGFITARIIPALTQDNYYTWQFEFNLVTDNEIMALLK